MYQAAVLTIAANGDSSGGSIPAVTAQWRRMKSNDPLVSHPHSTTWTSDCPSGPAVTAQWRRMKSNDALVSRPHSTTWTSDCPSGPAVTLLLPQPTSNEPGLSDQSYWNDRNNVRSTSGRPPSQWQRQLISRCSSLLQCTIENGW